MYMYGEGWVFEGGKGGISGGGGANGEWIWGDIDAPTGDYHLICTDEPMSYLGMVIEEETVGDEYRYEILMKRQCEPSIGRFSTYGSPAILDYDEDSTGEIEIEEYPHLPIPEDCWSSGEIIYTSAYTSLPSSYHTAEVTFDGSTYYYKWMCDGQQVYAHDAVLEARGQNYLDGLSGDYPGSIRIWGYYYQRQIIEESDFPGVFVPGALPGGGGMIPGVGEILDFFNQPIFGGPRIKRS